MKYLTHGSYESVLMEIFLPFTAVRMWEYYIPSQQLKTIKHDLFSQVPFTVCFRTTLRHLKAQCVA